MWRWVLLWAVLLLGAGVFYVLMGLRLWRAGKALLAESAIVTERLAAVGALVPEQPGPPSAPEPAPPAPDRRTMSRRRRVKEFGP